MTPAYLDISITPGSSWSKDFLLMQPDWIYRTIAEVRQTAPLELVVPAHGLPHERWPCWIEGSTSSQLNRDKVRQRFYQPVRLGEDALAINEINGAALRAAGGYLVYHPPVEMTNTVVELALPGIVLTSVAGLEVAPGKVAATLTPEQVEQLQPGGWSLRTRHSDGAVITWLCGEVRKHACQHTGC